MASEATNAGEFLVFNDGAGHYYAIPRETVEHYRLSEEEQAELMKGLDDEVLGYVMDNWFVRENLTAQYQAERRQDAARGRMVREGDSEEGSGMANEGETQSTGLRGALIGVFTMLRSSTPGTQK